MEIKSLGPIESFGRQEKLLWLDGGKKFARRPPPLSYLWILCVVCPIGAFRRRAQKRNKSKACLFFRVCIAFIRLMRRNFPIVVDLIVCSERQTNPSEFCSRPRCVSVPRISTQLVSVPNATATITTTTTTKYNNFQRKTITMGKTGIYLSAIKFWRRSNAYVRMHTHTALREKVCGPTPRPISPLRRHYK